MLTPTYLDHVPDDLVRLYEQAEDDILSDMASRISTTNLYIPATQWQERKLQELGLCHSDIVKRLSAMTGKSDKELETIIEQSGAESLRNDLDLYKAAGVATKGVSSAPFVQDALKAGLDKTGGLFQNLTSTTADTATKQFENALDRAYMQTSSGAFSPGQAITNAIKDLSRQGVGAITYPSGHVDNMDVAVRRAVVTGVNQTSAALSDKLADELGCDLVEVTAHAGARPDHAIWQGKVYSRSGKTPGYRKLSEATGYGTGAGLCGWNCRHSFFPYYEGTSRAYTQTMLSDYNKKTVQYNGRTLSEYDATQQQRHIERNIRRWKREYQAMSAAGLPTEQAASKIAQWNKRQADFLKQTGLKAQYDRTSVSGFTRAKAMKAAGEARKAAKTTLQTSKPQSKIKTATLEKFLGKTHADAIGSIVSTAPSNIVALWSTLESSINVINSAYTGGAHYSPLGRGININIASDALGKTWAPAYETTLHELGHLFDYTGNAKAGGMPLRAASEMHSSGLLGITIKDEAAGHVKTVWDRLKAEAVSNGLKPSTVKKGTAYAELAKELRALSSKERADISDMFEGATSAKVSAGFGHGGAYWKNRDNGKEAFAEMFSATACNPESLASIKRYFPKSYKVFEEIVEAITKGTI